MRVPEAGPARAPVAGPAPDGEPVGGPHPAVDIVTDRRAVVLCGRPVVGLSGALADAVRRFTPTNRIVTLVTGPDTRLTLPLRTLAGAGVVQWVVELPHRDLFDGMTGASLEFDQVDFRPTGTTAAAFGEVPAPESLQVLVSMTLEHRPTVHARLGAAVEAFVRAFTGVPPTGWGLHEPVSQPWDRSELTAQARRRMPEETRMVVVGAATRAGGPAIASVTARRTERGVEEHLLALINAGATTRPVAEIRDLCRQVLTAICEHETVGFGWTHLRAGRADCTEPARARAVPMPLSLVIGPRAVRGLGPRTLAAAPLPPATPVGRPRLPALYWALGEGETTGWEQLAALVRHLRPEHIAEVAPQLAALGAEYGSGQAR